ncbi:MAG: NAD(P)-dependent oxidoreductase [Actinocatenispora sp.]
MHVFLAGSTGVLGRRIVPLLIAQGHQVTALTRRQEAAATLTGAGAEPVLADVLDAEAVAHAIRVAAPDVVMHQLTDLGAGSSAANAEMRVTGTRNLVDAAKAAGVGRIIAQSVAWAYEPGDAPATEDTPLDADAPAPRETTVRGVTALESAVRELPDWVVLRYGLLYGPETWYAPGGLMADNAQAGKLTADRGVSSFVQVADAAAAAVAALDWPSGAVNVCDDEPAPAREWLPEFCAAIGAPVPEPTGDREGWARGADNGRARAELGWTPRYPSWRAGFAALAELG